MKPRGLCQTLRQAILFNTQMFSRKEEESSLETKDPYENFLYATVAKSDLRKPTNITSNLLKITRALQTEKCGH